MDEMKTRQIIQGLRKKWNLYIGIACLMLALGAGICISVLFMRSGNDYGILAIFVFSILFYFIFKFFLRDIGDKDVSQFLDQSRPEMEESTALLLRPWDSLNGLEKLQVNRIQERLKGPVSMPPSIRKKLSLSFVLLFSLCLLGYALFRFTVFTQRGMVKSTVTEHMKELAEVQLPQVSALKLEIIPPAYTSITKKLQTQFNLEAEQGSRLIWNIKTNKPVKNIQLIFNDHKVLNLQNTNDAAEDWTAGEQMNAPGFYQVNIDGQISGYYQMEMIRDQPPVISMLSPKPNTLIDAGQPEKIFISATVTDDYGLDSCYIQATISNGEGEAVKFKELQIKFPDFKPGYKEYQFQKYIDLKTFGMVPGDELYFYLKAMDNNRQEKRSDIYIVRLEDTSQLMNSFGLVNGLDFKLELFRSERQIIIETEQLIRDRDTISLEKFNEKSNDLGEDQKLLRLRYGKFLGEEAENGIGEEEEHNKPGLHNEATAFGNPDKVVNQFTHKHDNAEDATFFDIKTKSQLKATLTEMWKAELQLRISRPAQALPFAYKALKLLKDLQQQTRVYVAKTGMKSAALKPENRLTGNLNKIIQPVSRQDNMVLHDSTIDLRKAIGILAILNTGEKLQKNDVEILGEATQRLSAKASADPVQFLPAFKAINRITEGGTNPNDIHLAGNALRKMISLTIKNPYLLTTFPDMNL